jgi:hypothetical protein
MPLRCADHPSRGPTERASRSSSPIAVGSVRTVSPVGPNLRENVAARAGTSTTSTRLAAALMRSRQPAATCATAAPRRSRRRDSAWSEQSEYHQQDRVGEFHLHQ